MLIRITSITIAQKNKFDTVFVLDISKAFNSVDLEKSSILIARFDSPFSTYEYLRLTISMEKITSNMDLNYYIFFSSNRKP
ncbi:Hypothetical protein SRAE_0000060400 [Strongyloides ratti]|uniref:Reverse transcriptase domain-containing protein n=1 Tax=Strongyloides ratti TaxID=34506 RepID=A0A090KVD4_STRRB|nr:Hypothetical protein SRAE_0000060400 [Strongyloides ratti]CEF61480.1 Hypothetical protein SRAE_0000060400 [Strongyloides ratti]